jgi:hypothetical protein
MAAAVEAKVTAEGYRCVAAYLTHSEVLRRALHTRMCSFPPGQHMTLHSGTGQSCTRLHLGAAEAEAWLKPGCDHPVPSSWLEGSLAHSPPHSKEPTHLSHRWPPCTRPGTHTQQSCFLPGTSRHFDTLCCHMGIGLQGRSGQDVGLS